MCMPTGSALHLMAPTKTQLHILRWTPLRRMHACVWICMFGQGRTVVYVLQRRLPERHIKVHLMSTPPSGLSESVSFALLVLLQCLQRPSRGHKLYSIAVRPFAIWFVFTAYIVHICYKCIHNCISRHRIQRAMRPGPFEHVYMNPNPLVAQVAARVLFSRLWLTNKLHPNSHRFNQMRIACASTTTACRRRAIRVVNPPVSTVGSSEYWQRSNVYGSPGERIHVWCSVRW